MAKLSKPNHCNSCGVTDPALFYKSNKSKCIQCLSLKRKASYLLALDELNFLGSSKVCSVCKANLPLSSYSPEKIQCKLCSRVKRRSDVASNRNYYMWKSAKYRAFKKNLEFTISPEDIIIPSHCPVLGIPLSTQVNGKEKGKKLQSNSPSLDRIDNSKGYIPSNIQVISNRANFLKSDATPEELKKILAYVESKLPK